MENKDVATLINDLEKLHVRYEAQHQALRKAELKEAKELVLDHHQKEVKRPLSQFFTTVYINCNVLYLRYIHLLDIYKLQQMYYFTIFRTN